MSAFRHIEGLAQPFQRFQETRILVRRRFQFFECIQLIPSGSYGLELEMSGIVSDRDRVMTQNVLVLAGRRQQHFGTGGLGHVPRYDDRTRYDGAASAEHDAQRLPRVRRNRHVLGEHVLIAQQHGLDVAAAWHRSDIDVPDSRKYVGNGKGAVRLRVRGRTRPHRWGFLAGGQRHAKGARGPIAGSLDVDAAGQVDAAIHLQRDFLARRRKLYALLAAVFAARRGERRHNRIRTGDQIGKHEGEIGRERRGERARVPATGDVLWGDGNLRGLVGYGSVRDGEPAVQKRNRPGGEMKIDAIKVLAWGHRKRRSRGQPAGVRVEVHRIYLLWAGLAEGYFRLHQGCGFVRRHDHDHILAGKHIRYAIAAEPVRGRRTDAPVGGPAALEAGAQEPDCRIWNGIAIRIEHYAGDGPQRPQPEGDSVAPIAGRQMQSAGRARGSAGAEPGVLEPIRIHMQTILARRD